MGPSRPRFATESVRSRARGFALAFPILVVALPAAANEEREEELLRWVPSLGVYFDMLGQKAEGAITPGFVNERPAPPSSCIPTAQDLFGCPSSQREITTATASSDTSVASLVGGSLELMTARLLEAFLSRRLFSRADAAIAFAFERNLAGERKPGPFFTDPLKPSENDVFERSVGGQGSRAKFQVRPLVVGAGVGVAFTTTVFGRTIRLKPSLEYLREEVDLIASVRRAVKLQDPTPDLSGFRLISLSASEKETLDGLGGGLELESDAGRLGPIVVSMFVNGRGYHFLGNLHHTLTDTNERGETASWYYDFDPWSWRAGVGARFRWLPE